MASFEPSRQTEALLRRLRGMGLEASELPGGRTALVRLRLSGRSFHSPAGSHRFESITLSLVGANRVKCLSPRPLFYLPILSIANCDTPAAIEERVRRAWDERMASLARVHEQLERMGVQPAPLAGGAALAFPLELEEKRAEVTTIQPRSLILPGHGPLSGIALREAGRRLFQPDSDCSSGVDLEIAITTRLEQLAREEAAAAEQRRLAAVALAEQGPRLIRQPLQRVLLVGPRVGADAALAGSFRLRGYRVVVVRSAREARRCFEQQSFELVLADAQVDRGEGAELVPALQSLPGIAQLPVILVDDRLRPARKEAARKAGATAYLVHPVDVARIQDRLQRLVDAPERRRFRRYAKRLAVRWSEQTGGGHLTELGRGGMLLRAERELPLHSLDRYEISLPELNQVLRVDAEVVYQRDGEGFAPGGIGLRFQGFPEGNERTLIAYLEHLDPVVA